MVFFAVSASNQMVKSTGPRSSFDSLNPLIADYEGTLLMMRSIRRSSGWSCRLILDYHQVRFRQSD